MERTADNKEAYAYMGIALSNFELRVWGLYFRARFALPSKARVAFGKVQSPFMRGSKAFCGQCGGMQSSPLAWGHGMRASKWVRPFTSILVTITSDLTGMMSYGLFRFGSASNILSSSITILKWLTIILPSKIAGNYSSVENNLQLPTWNFGSLHKGELCIFSWRYFCYCYSPVKLQILKSYSQKYLRIRGSSGLG